MIPWKSTWISKIKLGLLVQNNVKHNVAFDPWKWFMSGVNGITWELVRHTQSEAQCHSYLSARPPYSWVRESKLKIWRCSVAELSAGCACTGFGMFSLPTPAPESLSQPCSQNLFFFSLLLLFCPWKQEVPKNLHVLQGKVLNQWVLGESTNNPEP